MLVVRHAHAHPLVGGVQRRLVLRPELGEAPRFGELIARVLLLELGLEVVADLLDDGHAGAGLGVDLQLQLELGGHGVRAVGRDPAAGLATEVVVHRGERRAVVHGTVGLLLVPNGGTSDDLGVVALERHVVVGVPLGGRGGLLTDLNLRGHAISSVCTSNWRCQKHWFVFRIQHMLSGGVDVV